MVQMIGFTKEQIEAIGYALDLAHGDQEAYIDLGSPEQDYGEDWEHVRAFKAGQFREIAAVGEMLGLHGEVERWNALASKFMGEEE